MRLKSPPEAVWIWDFNPSWKFFGGHLHLVFSWSDHRKRPGLNRLEIITQHSWSLKWTGQSSSSFARCTSKVESSHVW